MSFLKYSAPKIFDGFNFVQDKVLIATNNGCIEAIENKEDAGEDIICFEGIITPGFINTHCHLELSYLKEKIAKKTGLTQFILDIVTNRNIAIEEIVEAIIKADEEMYANGIVAVGDICNTANTIQKKKNTKIYYHNFLEVTGWIPAVADKRWQIIQDLQNQFSTAQLSSSIVPHAPYSVSNELWSLIKPSFNNNIISIHNQEALAEDELFKKGTGAFITMYQQMNIENNNFKATEKSSLQSVYANLSNSKNSLLVHNTFTNKDDIDFVKQFATNPYFCTCINANLYIENSLPPLPLLIQNDCEITIGTDSLASNDSLSIWDEIKIIQQNFSTIPLQTILKWATINGAKALAIEDKFGSFEKGKQPGIVLINNNKPQRLV